MSRAVAEDWLAVRETIEDYLHFVDARQWDRVAACYTSDATSQFNFEPDVLLGGADVAQWVSTRLAPYLGTMHSLGNVHIEIDGGVAVCESHVTASLLYAAGCEQRVAVRAIRYRDRLRRERDRRWRIYERRHEPLWQYDVLAGELRV